MENEILWKWELLCGEFELARQNYLNHFAPLIDKLSSAAGCRDSRPSLDQIRQAENAWNSWLDIQIKIKAYVGTDG